MKKKHSLSKSRKEALRGIIKKKVIIFSDKTRAVGVRGETPLWLFDFRAVSFDPEFLDLIAELFWEIFRHEYPFQIGGEETASLPFIAAIVLKFQEKGMPINGFYVRKSRKKDGLQKIIEGKLNGEKIILFDDLIHSGKSLNRQIERVEKENKKVYAIFSIVRYLPKDFYQFAQRKNVAMHFLFSLDDFDLKYPAREIFKPLHIFNIKWKTQSSNPNQFYVIPKSAPTLDKEKLFAGNDNGVFWALDQKSGFVSWQYKVPIAPDGKSIFSTPALYKNTVFFGTYEGNVYALDTETGSEKWVFQEADWVGSSPALAPKLSSLFIGLEFGLIRKKGGLVALDMHTGRKKWLYGMPAFVHASPLYIEKENMVIVGCNDGGIYTCNAKTGALLWRAQAQGPVSAAAAYDAKRRLICIGSFDGNLYIFDAQTGKVLHKYKTEAGICSIPLIHNDAVIFSSLDKYCYSVDLNSYKLNWKLLTGGRIFSSPVLVKKNVFIGSNDGRLYELDFQSGKMLSYFQVTERIVNKIAYNEKTENIFLPTDANEIYCLEMKRRANNPS